MKSIVKKLQYGITFVAMVIILLRLTPVAAKAEMYSGSCGATSRDHVNWYLDTEAHTLEIVGEGKIKDYYTMERNEDGESEYELPELTEDWHEYRTKVYSLTVSEGITSLGSLSFAAMLNLKEVSLPDTLTTIKDYCFKNCRSLTEITIPSSVTFIGERAFGDCASFKKIDIPEGVVTPMSLR